MKTIAQAIAQGRKAAGISQSELARKLNITPQSVQAWESGRSTPRPLMLVDISEALNMPLEPLMSLALVRMNGPVIKRRKLLEGMIQSAAPEVGEGVQLLDRQDVWDDGLPLDGEEVSVPFIKEVESATEHGRTTIEIDPKTRLRFGKATLISLGVRFDKAFCLVVQGDSMAPILPDGSTVAVDTGSTSVRDGKTYAINQGGHLRVKTLHRLPDGGIKLRSFNRDEYPDEQYSLEEMNERDITIIGRVFWSAVVW